MAASDPTAASRRKARRLQEDEARRADALAAAAKIFAAKGFDGAQMVEIAAVAELPLASLYALFDGKDDLYRRVLHQAAEQIRDRVRERIDPIEDPVERVKTLIAALFDSFEENRPLLRIVVSGTGGLPWRIRRHLASSPDLIDGFQRWVTELCVEAVREPGGFRGVEPPVLASAIIGTVTHVASRSLAESPDVDLRAVSGSVVELFRRLVGDRAPTAAP